MLALQDIRHQEDRSVKRFKNYKGRYAEMIFCTYPLPEDSTLEKSILSGQANYTSLTFY